MQRAIPATLMRGGTSKGIYFHAKDLPADKTTRDRVLRSILGSPDIRQIDGIGGAHPLTSKVAILSPPTHPDADIDYLFLQVGVDKATVQDGQTCGNLLAGVGAWAIEHGFVEAHEEETTLRVHLTNTGALTKIRVSTPEGTVQYDGEASIDGVPGTAAPIMITFLDVAGATCGALLPTGNISDMVEGVEVTCIDNGMPVVILSAEDFGLKGNETPADLEQNEDLKQKVEKIRLAVGPLMNLGDVTHKTIPKMTLVSAPLEGGTLSTRTFIPHRVHEAIGVFGAVSVATASVLPGSVAEKIAGGDHKPGLSTITIEHPTGAFHLDMTVSQKNGQREVSEAALLRTARKIMAGDVFIPKGVWEDI